jgi:septal ring factor EnvC (AmiA/AmiB activator)
MMAGRTEWTVGELERLLEEKKQLLASLHRRRDQIEQRLQAVRAKISRIQGTPERARTEKTVRRPKNERSLKEVVTELLGKNKKGLTLHDLSEAVLATGYKTTSTDFKNTLYQTLYHHDRIELDKETGLYSLC